MLQNRIAMVFALPALALMLTTSAAVAEPHFSSQHTEDCINAAAAASPSQSGYAVLECVSLSARACMQSPGGDTTYGMMDCLSAELDYWKGRMTSAYQQRLEIAQAQDQEMRFRQSATMPQGDALIDLHDRWQEYRQAACLYEQSLWMGGTGGGPATLVCHIDETAVYTLRLEGWWSR